ncbi:MAG TPA: phenylalanine--tRNA ligase beta subunit-related protein [Solirubrobacterales bacterium]
MSASETDRIGWEPAPSQGWVAPHLSAELPGLGIAWVDVDCAASSRSPDPVRGRLRELSDRFYGSHAVHLRERPIPAAYRVFFRHIGLDPDASRTPIEQLALDRLHDGAFKAQGLPVDALTIATVETGVALRAFDADRVEGPLCIHDSAPGEAIVDGGEALRQGTLVLADARGPLAPLFGGEEGACEVGTGTRRVRIVAIQVGGVPQISVDEALWMAVSTIGES